MTASLISRINALTLGCNKGAAAALPAGSNKEIYLFRAYGMVMALEQGETDTGEYMALIGRFQAENTQDGTEGVGKLFESDTLFLPPGGHDSLVNQVIALGVVWDDPNKRSKKRMGRIVDGKTLNIAMDVYVKKDTNPSGITYVTKPIMETVDDPLAIIRAEIAEVEEKTRQLAAAQNEVVKQLPPGKHSK